MVGLHFNRNSLRSNQFNPTSSTVWSCLLYYTAITVTVSTVDEDLLYPLKLLIHPHTIGYFLATFNFLMVMSCLIIFYRQERRNRVGHWLQHPYIEEARKNNPIVGLNKYKWMISKEEMETKPVMLLCPLCNVETCSRAHHCRACNRCVLRRDHHCFVLGTCVGLGNQRYFVNILFWCAFGCALFIGFHGHYFLNRIYAVIQEYRNIFPEEVDFIKESHFWLGMRLLHIVVFCISNLPIDQYICDAVLLCFTIIWFMAALGFFCVQLVVTSKGYTMYEFVRAYVMKRLNPDGLEFTDRFRLVFGKRWLLNIFFPRMWDESVLTEEIAVNLFRPKKKAE